MADPVSIGIALAMAAAGGASAIQQNKQLSKQKSAQRRAADVQQKQIRSAANLERKKVAREGARIRGSLQVRQAESGSNLGTSLLQSQLAQTLNFGIIDENLTNQLAASEAGLGINLAALTAQQADPFSGAISGGIQGAQLGSSLEGLE